MGNDLFEKVDGVPAYSYPVYWDRKLRVADNLLQVQSWTAHYEEKMPPLCSIDEAAIMVPDPWHRARLAEHLRIEGWEKFNQADDLVYTSPFGTRYLVEYHFFQNSNYPFRLEVMMLAEDNHGVRGFSPLHQGLFVPDQFGSVGNHRYPMPHLSFKVTGRRRYSQVLQHLKDNGCLHAMTCQSTYGTFGYFIGNETMRQIYLKPRVNLRDTP